MLAGRPALRRRARRGGEEALGQPDEIVGTCEDHREGLFVGEHVLSEFGPERRQPLADGGEPRLLFRREPGAGAHERGMMTIENARGLRVERQRRSPPRGARRCARTAHRREESRRARAPGSAPFRARSAPARRCCRRPPDGRTRGRRDAAPRRCAPARRSCCRRSAARGWRRWTRSRRAFQPAPRRRPDGNARDAGARTAVRRRGRSTVGEVGCSRRRGTSPRDFLRLDCGSRQLGAFRSRRVNRDGPIRVASASRTAALARARPAPPRRPLLHARISRSISRTGCLVRSLSISPTMRAFTSA